MNEQIRKLLEVQQLDLRIAELKKQRVDARERLRRERRKAEETAGILEEDTEQSKVLASHIGTLELDLRSRDEKIAKFREQQAGSRSNREYATFQKEIASEEAERSRAEDGLLDLYDKMDGYKAEKEKALATCEELGAEVARLERDVAAKDIELRDEGARVAAERERLGGTIDDEYLSEYNRIARKAAGRAVVRVICRDEKNGGYSCQGCHMNVTAQVVTQILAAKGPTRCQNCFRILYADDSDPLAGGVSQ